MSENKQRPRLVVVTLVMILANSLLWLVFGVIIVADLHPSLPLPSGLNTVLGALSIGIAAFLAGAALFIMKHNRVAYYLLLIIFAMVSILTIFDDFGLPDLFFLLLNIIPIYFLIKNRQWYLQAKQYMIDNN